MSLKIIRSGLTSMNSDVYIEEIESLYLSEKGKKLILLVPDRFSYIAEKLVCERVGGTGLCGVDVLTLRQLTRRLSNADNVLASEGKQILLRRIADKKLNEDSVFYGAKDKNGFISSVLDLMDDWKRFCVYSSELEDDISKLPDGITKSKLTDLSCVYQEYCSEFSEKQYTDECDMLLSAAQFIKTTDEFSDAVIWIDGFVEFIPSEMSVIDAFVSVGADVRIYLPCKKNGTVERTDVYYVPQQTFFNLKKMCEDNGYEYSVHMVGVNKPMADEITYLCDTYDDAECVYDGECRSIELREADDIYTEVEYVASRILDLVCTDGMNFSDISVLCGNPDVYNPCIEATFSRYSIPYFTDYKIPLSVHPVAVLLLTVFDILENRSFSKNDITKYLKTGYVIDNSDDVDLLCLFCEKRGLRGGMWLDDKYFEGIPGGFFDEAMGKEIHKSRYSEKLKTLRKLAVTPLMNYYESSKGKLEITEHIKAFFGFLNDIDLYGGIEKRVEAFEKSGDENEASRLAHVWNILVRLFEQMPVAADGEKISRSTFGSYLRAGIEGAEISIIPTVTNGVSVSDAGHRNGTEVKALFIIGATAESVPAVKHEDGIVTEDELENVGSLPATTGKSFRNLSKEFELLTAFSETSRLLYLSYCKIGTVNEKSSKSSVFELIKNKFPKLVTGTVTSDSFVVSPESMLHKLLVGIASDKPLSSSDSAALEWFLENDKWNEYSELLDEAEKYSELKGTIPHDISAELYKNLTSYSVSRLEKYFSCPFMYFLNYGLKLDDCEEYGMKSSDTGDIVHHAIAHFCELIEKGANTPTEKKDRWLSADKSIIERTVDKLIADLKENSGFDDEPKIEAVFSRIATTVKKAAEHIALMMRNGKYTISGNELEFNDFTLSGTDGSVSFRGVIDRLDVLEENGKTNLRIIDYKTGEKEFKFQNALNGIDMQLLIYAMAAESFSDENSEIAGFFYNSLKNRIVSADDPKKAASEISKLSKLSGVLVENVSDGEFEVKSGVDMDCNLFELRESVYLPVKLKKGDLYHGASSVRSPGFINDVFRAIKNIAVKGANNIESGDVRVYPYVARGKDTCKYCPYGSVCMYDKCKGSETNNGEAGNLLYEDIKENNSLGGEG